MALKASAATGTEANIWDAEDFAIEHGCDVITASLSWKYHYNPDYATWRQQEDLIMAADIAHSNSAGNQWNNACCPVPYNVSAPGLCPPPWLHPDQTLTGGLSGVTAVGNVTAADAIDVLSSRGPSTWQEIPEFGDYPWNPGMGLLKPDVSAPGSGTTSLAWDDNHGYRSFGGTSAAAPHVGGAFCLLRQAHPELTTIDLSQIIQLGAVDLGDPGKDNIYGAGRLDILASHMLVEPLSIQPPTDVTAVDTPGDGGGSIDVAWTLSADDGAGNALVEGYEVYRTLTPGLYFPVPLAAVPGGTAFYQDATTTDGVEYYYRVVAVGNGMSSEPSNEAGPAVSEPNQPASVDHEPANRPPLSRLLRNSSNPFSWSTQVHYELAAAAPIELAVYDVTGARVRTLVAGRVSQGVQVVVWDGLDASGREAPSGVYWLRLVGPNCLDSRKILKIR
jgi:hypothetical protein